MHAIIKHKITIHDKKKKSQFITRFITVSNNDNCKVYFIYIYIYALSNMFFFKLNFKGVITLLRFYMTWPEIQKQPVETIVDLRQSLLLATRMDVPINSNVLKQP